MTVTIQETSKTNHDANYTFDELLDSIALFSSRIETNSLGSNSDKHNDVLEPVDKKAPEHQSAELKSASVVPKKVPQKLDNKKETKKRKSVRKNRGRTKNQSQQTANQKKANAPTKSEKKRKPRKQYPGVLQSWNVKHATTIVRFHPEDHPQDIDLQGDRKQCVVCMTSFHSDRVLQHHLERSHGGRFDLSPLLKIDNRNRILVQEVVKVQLQQLPRADIRFHLTITNNTRVALLLKSVYVFDGCDLVDPIFDTDGVLRMAPGYFHEDEIHLEGSPADRLYSLLITVNPVDCERLPYDIVVQFHFKESANKNVRIEGTPLQFGPLPCLNIPEAVQILHHNNFSKRIPYGFYERQILRQVEEAKKPSSLCLDNYKKQLTLLNLIEAEHVRCEFEGYTIELPRLKKVKKSKKRKDGSTYEQIFFALSIDQFKNRPSMIDEDVFVRVSVEADQSVDWYGGTVECVEPTVIVMKMTDDFPMSGHFLRIEFLFNKVPFQLEHQAMNLLSQCRKETILFPSGVECCHPSKEITSFQWIRTNIATNEEQMMAVRNIVNRTSFPAPYVLFGPPGTGKSSTLVEAIGQIYRLRPAANILVVAPSNFAANEITSRLLANMPQNSVYRFFSKRCLRKVDDIEDGILEVSNLIDKEYDVPCYEDIYFARVVVATMATAGRLVQARIQDKHFSYVIIDECGSAKEISALVPIAELATCGEEIHASIVLAGDPKQLGPVVQYAYLKHTNHSISLLERIMKLDLYSMDLATKEYDTRLITQLRDSFRSHVKLLQFSNCMFYDGQLRAKAPPEITDWALGWRWLPNPRCPLIFCSVTGQSKQDNIGFSLYNVEEGEFVLAYVEEILTNGINGRKVNQSEIGIISPYARQVLHLRESCKGRNWTGIEIGSAEQYQGREKEIIIISTVRSQCNHVGFLSDVKRLNVMLTRAKALMIVVGDANTLLSNSLWRKFIKYCQVNNACMHLPSPANKPVQEAPKKSRRDKKSNNSNNSAKLNKTEKSESEKSKSQSESKSKSQKSKNRKESGKTKKVSRFKESKKSKKSKDQKKMENSEKSKKANDSQQPKKGESKKF